MPSLPKSVYSVSNTQISLRGLGNLTKSVGRGSIKVVKLNTRFSAAYTNSMIRNLELNVTDRPNFHESS